MRSRFAAALAAAVCMFTACGNGGSTAEMTESKAEEPEKAVSEQAFAQEAYPEETQANVSEDVFPQDSEEEKCASEEECENAARLSENTVYVTEYIDPETVASDCTREEPSDEEKRLYEFYRTQRNDEELLKNIDDSRARMIPEYPDDEHIPDVYGIYDSRYFADFDSDGKLELYVYRCTNLDPMSNWADYRELWYTDGEKCVMLYSGIGRGDFAGVFEPQDGIPVFYFMPEIMMGAGMQKALVYAVKDGEPALCERPEGECFMCSGETLLIYRNEFGFSEFESAEYDAYQKGEPLQILGWENGNIEIISGYGRK